MILNRPAVRILPLLPLALLLLTSASAAKATPITIGYLSFSSGPDGENASFTFSNITDEDFDNTELIYRGQLGGFGGDGNYYTIAGESSHVFDVGGGFFQFGEIDGTLSRPDFVVGSASYQTLATTFQAYLYSEEQLYLGPGQTAQVAVTVEGNLVTPEPGSSWLLATWGMLLFFRHYRSRVTC